ncbi:MAG: fibrobacter succinogenes major paralogous domain-containing protein [Prolixibacteraceae bacterium]|nr:fibrobacter succinogenes major paralogous domain-containing protein [Prolixibacteraceae bacterium]
MKRSELLIKTGKISLNSALLLLLLLLNLFVFGQAPKKVNYQTVVRDLSGDLVRLETVTIQISILQGSVGGVAVYTETHNPETNINGLASIQIGSGTIVEGNFSTIDWSNSPYFLLVEIDPVGGSSYDISWTSEILSSPYALYSHKTALAGTVKGENQGLSDVIAENNEADGQIKNLTDPTDEQDAATKAYADLSINDIETLKILLGVGTLIDIDGNIYRTVKIGNQEWMAENLRVSKFNNGDNLRLVSSPGIWTGETNPCYCWYDNDKTTYGYTYGALYNWYTVNAPGIGGKNVCPEGWKVPDDDDWTTLEDYLIANGYNYDGTTTDDKTAKSLSSKTNWLASTGGTPGSTEFPSYRNKSGFSALPAGMCASWNGNFYYLGERAHFWSISEGDLDKAITHRISYNGANFYDFETEKRGGFSIRCLKGYHKPSVSTSEISNITTTTASSGGNILYNGGNPIVERGVCWNTTGTPTIDDDRTSDGTGSGSFVSNLTGLTPNTIYYLRAYATHSEDTGYGDQKTFITYNSSVSDIDGNVYYGIFLGTQEWMGENLNVTRYKNGDEIGTTTPADLDISAESEPKYQWAYDGNESFADSYGRLYTWHAINDSRFICPTGWRMSTRDDWDTLIDYFGGGEVAGKELKEAGTAHWNWQNIATNSSQFTALPGGERSEDGTFSAIGDNGYWWTTKETAFDAWAINMYHGSSYAYVPSRSRNYGLSVRCIKGDENPILTTLPVNDITTITASSGGNITYDGGTAITHRGVCWNTTGTPTTSDSKTLDGAGAGTFESEIEGLTANTTYYIRAYATNGTTTVYGNEVVLHTYTQSIVDVEGNSYYTVTIGTQEWMAENLKTTTYKNSDPIGTTTPSTLDISGETSPKYQWAYDGDVDNVSTYGRLYTWYAVNDSRGVCPTGWHIPSQSEYETLIAYLGGTSVAGGKLKEAGTYHWFFANYPGTNESGFTALAGGYRDKDSFGQITVSGLYYTSSTDGIFGIYLFLSYDNDYATITHNYYSYYGRSVRCVKD